MMKKYITALWFLFLSLSSIAQADDNKTSVQEGLKQFFAALANRDSMAMKQWSTRDLALIEYGNVWNIDTLIRIGIVQNTAADFSRSDRFEFIQTEVRGGMALVTYRLFSRINRNGTGIQVQWIESATLVLEDKRWKLKFLHSTLLKRSSQ